jgi:hypothetical protein
MRFGVPNGSQSVPPVGPLVRTNHNELADAVPSIETAYDLAAEFQNLSVQNHKPPW